MNLETFVAYCLGKPHVEETLPFGPDTLVMKVAGKMFAVTGLDETDFRLNLKCDPERALKLRDRYPSVRPGWHMNKTHWNTIFIEETRLSDRELEELIDHSYDLVVAKMTKKRRAELGL